MSKKSIPMNKKGEYKIISCRECPYGGVNENGCINECGYSRCLTKGEWQKIQDHFKKKYEIEINELKQKIEKLKK